MRLVPHFVPHIPTLHHFRYENDQKLLFLWITTLSGTLTCGILAHTLKETVSEENSTFRSPFVVLPIFIVMVIGVFTLDDWIERDGAEAVDSSPRTPVSVASAPPLAAQVQASADSTAPAAWNARDGEGAKATREPFSQAHSVNRDVPEVDEDTGAGAQPVDVDRLLAMEKWLQTTLGPDGRPIHRAHTGAVVLCATRWYATHPRATYDDALGACVE